MSDSLFRQSDLESIRSGTAEYRQITWQRRSHFGPDLRRSCRDFMRRRASNAAQVVDALYFMLYGISRDDAAYIMDSFPITRSSDAREHNGRYLTKDLILAYMNALAAGDTESVVAPAG